MSLLIVGGDGLIGNSLRQVCRERNLPYHATSRRSDTGEDMLPMDIAKEPPCWQLPAGIEVAVICAAATSISVCQAEPIRTHRINVEAPALLAQLLQAKGSAVIFLSTSLVLGGHRKAARWDDPLQPETMYGRQKAEAELRVAQTGPRVAILRLTKVVHPNLRLFTAWATKLKSGLVIEPFSDMVFSPIPLALVTMAILQIADTFEPGIFQLSGDRDISYAAAANLLAERLNVSTALVQERLSASADLDISFVPRHTALTPNLPGPKPTPCPSVEQTLTDVFNQI